MAKRKIKIRKRLHNIWTWVRNPFFLLCTAFFMGTFAFLLVLIDPCGKYSHPVNGVCSNGNGFMNPLTFSAVITLLTVVIALLAFSSTENKDSPSFNNFNVIKGITGYVQSWPKWRKKWYPFFLVISYALIAAFFYITDQGGGLRWYHYIGQFGIVAPLFASYPAYKLASFGRKKLRLK